MFRTINQDYGSFYYRQPTTCIPDVLKEKVFKRHEQFTNWVIRPSCNRQSRNNCQSNLFPQCLTQTVTITHRKKFPGSIISNTDELITDFLVKQIVQRLKDLISPRDYDDVFNCAKILVTELLNKQPCLCADDVINQVIAIMTTSCDNSNIGNKK